MTRQKKGVFSKISIFWKKLGQKKTFFFGKNSTLFSTLFSKKNIYFCFFPCGQGRNRKKTLCICICIYLYIQGFVSSSSFGRRRDKTTECRPSTRDRARDFKIFGKIFQKKFLKPIFSEKNSENSNFFLKKIPKIQIFFGGCKLEIGKKSFSENFKVQNFKRDIARELEKENERLSPSKGGQRTYFSPYYPLFLHVRGGCTHRDIIMIIVLSILLFFLSIFYVLAYKPIPLLRGSGRI